MNEPITEKGLHAAIIAGHQRPPRPGALSNAIAFGWRAMLKMKYMPEQMFDVLVTPIMFTVMFTYLFGGALAGSPGDYLQFLLPGILAQTVIFISLYTGVSLNTDIGKGVYDRFKSMPIWMPAPIAGAMLGDILRYSIASLIVVTIGLLLGYRPGTGVIGVIGCLLLLNVFGLGLAWIFTTLGLLLRSPGAVMTISWVFLMPITFASNIYVDPATMPDWLQSFVAVNPVTHLVTALRGIMDGSLTLLQLLTTLATPLVLASIFGPLTMVCYRRKR